MPTLSDIELAAVRLRNQLHLAGTPELRVICIARFFQMYQSNHSMSLEASVREFLPRFVSDCVASRSSEFLPEDREALGSALEILLLKAKNLITPIHIDTIRETIAKISRTLDVK